MAENTLMRMQHESIFEISDGALEKVTGSRGGRTGPFWIRTGGIASRRRTRWPR